MGKREKIELMEEVFTFRKIYKAYLDCRNLKRSTVNAVSFEYNLERRLFSLQERMKEGSYRPGRSICFVATEPVYREIFAADFEDRVVHHLLINELEEFGEKKFVFNSFSCRKGKGTHFGVKRLKKSVFRRNYQNKLYYLQMDISGFFMSIDKRVLYAVVKKFVLKQRKSEKWKRDVLWLSKIIIFHQVTKNYVKKGDLSLFSLVPKRKSLFGSREGTGLPIGNYSSQFFANLYLDQLDQFVKRKLKCKHYFRYVDDFILLSEDKEQLKQWRDEIEEFLGDYLKLKVSHKKTKLHAVDKGIDFLGYFVISDYVLARRRVVKTLKKKLDLIKEGEGRDIKERQLQVAMINSYFAHFKHCNSKRLREHFCRYVFYKFNIYHTEQFEKVLLKKAGRKELVIKKSCLKRRRKEKINEKQKKIREERRARLKSVFAEASLVGQDMRCGYKN